MGPRTRAPVSTSPGATCVALNKLVSISTPPSVTSILKWKRWFCPHIVFRVTGHDKDLKTTLNCTKSCRGVGMQSLGQVRMVELSRNRRPAP